MQDGGYFARLLLHTEYGDLLERGALELRHGSLREGFVGHPEGSFYKVSVRSADALRVTVY